MPYSQFMSRDKIIFARRMRQNPTASEALLWRMLCRRQCAGYKFRQQSPILGYIVDFYCPQKRLAIEVDGPCHDTTAQKLRDKAKDHALQSHGIQVMRIPAVQVHLNLAMVVSQIKWALAAA
jgi:very-short-patch-repair endonuclease